MATTAGSRSWALLGALGVAALAQPFACRPDGGSSTPAAQAQVRALQAVGPEVVLPTLDRFLDAAADLEAATAAWSAAPTDAAAQADAQSAWLRAMLIWQELEVFQIGPAASSLTAVAGQDLRDEVYSWPSINACRVDQETVEAEWDEPGWMTENLVNVYGLDAIEYLLWAPADNDCPGQVPINADGSWDALGPDGVAAHRADYAASLSATVLDQAAALRAAWTPSGGDFSNQLALEPGSPYASEQDALNAVFDALFYLETTTKDRKLALPLGIIECSEDRCPDDVEAWHSGAGAAAIAANLRGFRALFTGGDGDGMDDLLVELGEDALVEQVLTDTDAAIALADGLADRPLQDAIVDDPESVEALHAAVKRVADELKGDVATVLTLQIPAEAAGDND